MTDIKVGSLSDSPAVIHATIVTARDPTWRVLTAEEIAIGCTGNPDDEYDSIGERSEGMFVGRIISMLLAKIGIIDSDGFCSTYREWHILCRGFYSGFAAALGEKFAPCPDKWKDEAQYYEGGQEVGYILKNGKLWVPVTGIASSALTYVALNMDTVIPILMKFLNH